MRSQILSFAYEECAQADLEREPPPMAVIYLGARAPANSMTPATQRSARV